MFKGVHEPLKGKDTGIRLKTRLFYDRQGWLTTVGRNGPHSSNPQGFRDNGPYLPMKRWLDQPHKEEPPHMHRQECRGKDAEDHISTTTGDKLIRRQSKVGRQPSLSNSVMANARNSFNPSQISGPDCKSSTANGVNKKLAIGQSKEYWVLQAMAIGRLPSMFTTSGSIDTGSVNTFGYRRRWPTLLILLRSPSAISDMISFIVSS